MRDQRVLMFVFESRYVHSWSRPLPVWVGCMCLSTDTIPLCLSSQASEPGPSWPFVPYFFVFGLFGMSTVPFSALSARSRAGHLLLVPVRCSPCALSRLSKVLLVSAISRGNPCLLSLHRELLGRLRGGRGKCSILCVMLSFIDSAIILFAGLRVEKAVGKAYAPITCSALFFLPINSALSHRPCGSAVNAGSLSCLR